MGITNATDQTTLSNIWSTWQGQGVGPGSTGLTNLQTWLKGTATGGASSLPTFGGYYTPTSTTAYVPGVTSWNGTTVTTANKPLTYYAVCRLFNRAYPAEQLAGTIDTVLLSRGLAACASSAPTTIPCCSTQSGSLNPPGSMRTYTINYNAILSWLTPTTDPFPTQLRAGRIKYYGSIPTAITGTWPSYGSTDQRFWVEVIDHVLGFRQTSAGNYWTSAASAPTMVGYGSDFTWGTVSTNSPPPSHAAIHELYG